MSSILACKGVCKTVSELIVYIIMAGAGIAIYFYAGTFPHGTVETAGPSFWPQSLAFIMTISSVALAVGELRRRKAKSDTKQKADGENLEPVLIWKAIVAGITMLAYIMLMPHLGFHVSTVLLVIILSLLMDTAISRHNILMAFLRGVGVVLFMVFFFGHFLNARLEPGILSYLF